MCNCFCAKSKRIFTSRTIRYQLQKQHPSKYFSSVLFISFMQLKKANTMLQDVEADEASKCGKLKHKKTKPLNLTGV